MLRAHVFIAIVALLLLSNSTAWARYARPQLQITPVKRLAANLAQKLKKAPEDISIRHNLARLHAMAYATKNEELQTAPNRRTGELNVWFGYEPRPVPFRSNATDDVDKKKVAAAHLAEAIKHYEIILKAEPKNTLVRLGYGWVLSEAGKKDKAVAEFRQVVKAAWETEKGKRVAGLGWHSQTAEAARYLKPLLDEEKDKEEIAGLDEKTAAMNRVRRPVTPIAIPLQDNLTIQQLHSTKAVQFDADGSGVKKPWTWIAPQAGWLVYDQTGAGKVDSALQMFGNVTFWCFWKDGYRALASLDDNADGVLNNQELQHLAIWHDANANGISEPGEVKPLAHHRIVQLSCQGQPLAGRDDLISAGGVKFQNGQTRDSFDLILQPAPAASKR